MPRNIYIVRHSLADNNRHNRLLFGADGASLTAEGFNKATALQQAFVALGIQPETEPAAVSPKLRTRQTAKCAGFSHATMYEVLDEINSGLAPQQLDGMISRHELPSVAIEAAQAILVNPPPERVWFTHGMVIGALALELGIPESHLFIPEMPSISKIDLA